VSFANDMERALASIRRRFNALDEAVTDHVFRSITVGSPVTGAPGQPVDKGELLRSWKKVPDGANGSRIISTADHARAAEDGGGRRKRSKTGGSHSVRMTRLGWHRIVRFELERVKGQRR